MSSRIGVPMHTCLRVCDVVIADHEKAYYLFSNSADLHERGWPTRNPKKTERSFNMCSKMTHNNLQNDNNERKHLIIVEIITEIVITVINHF